MVSNAEPDVYHLLENQSDYYQKHGLPGTKEEAKQSLESMRGHLNIQEDMVKNAKKLPNGNYLYPDGTEISARMHNEMTLSQKGANKAKEIELANWEQKALLGKSYQERALQENVKYAAGNGQKQVRFPTSETAAKIQGYSKEDPMQKLLSSQHSLSNYPQEMTDLVNKVRYSSRAGYDENVKILGEYMKNNNITPKYSPEHTTILKKYADAPKMIKKTIGVEPKLVTDSKGNSWYEFDIPKSYREGTAEIKALKYGGSKNWLDDYNT
jgi:hypothetical protein